MSIVHTKEFTDETNLLSIKQIRQKPPSTFQPKQTAQ